MADARSRRTTHEPGTSLVAFDTTHLVDNAWIAGEPSVLAGV